MRWSISTDCPAEIHRSSIKESGKSVIGAAHACRHLSGIPVPCEWGHPTARCLPWTHSEWGRTAMGAKEVWMLLTGSLHLFLHLQVRLECLNQRRESSHWLLSVNNNCVSEVSHLGAIPSEAQVGAGCTHSHVRGLETERHWWGGEKRLLPPLSQTSFMASP